MHFYIFWALLFQIIMKYLHRSLNIILRQLAITFNIFYFVKQICIKIYIRSWYIKTMSVLNRVLSQFYCGNSFEARNANISEIISNILTKIFLISKIQNG